MTEGKDGGTPGSRLTHRLDDLLSGQDAEFLIKRDKPESDGDRKLRLFKDAALFLIGVGMLLALFIPAAMVTFDDAADPTTRRWCQSLVAGLVSSFVTYLVKRS